LYVISLLIAFARGCCDRACLLDWSLVRRFVSFFVRSLC